MDGRFNRGVSGYDQPSSGERRPSLTEIINKYMEEAAKSHAEQDEWLKKFYRNTETNQEAHDKIIQGLETKTDKVLFPSDFMVMDMLNTPNETMILERQFLATIQAEIDVFNKEISLGIGDASSRVEKTDDLHNENNYCNQEQGRKSVMGGKEGPEIYRMYEEGVIKKWYCYHDDDRKRINGGGLSFLEFLLVKYEETQEKYLIWDDRFEEWCNNNPNTPTCPGKSQS
ncbi:hypothetical protein Tco_0497369 [Tanacetum coccineum]